MVPDVEAVLAASFGLDDVPVLVRDAGALRAIVAADPFRADDPTHHHVLFLAAPVDPDVLAGLEPGPSEALLPAASGLELHLLTPGGLGRSRFGARLTDRRLGTTVTGRNWRTVTELLAMAAG